MDKCLFLFFIFFSLNYSLLVKADEIAKETDGSFVGDISNSMVNGSWGQEDVPHKTDSSFVGENTIKSDNSYFSGDNSDREEQESTDKPFAQDNSSTPTDGVFIGQDVHQQTDNSSAGDNYGK